MVCCGFVVCWTPNEISFFLNFAGYAIDFSGWFYHFNKLLTLSYPSLVLHDELLLWYFVLLLNLLSFWFYHFTVVLVFTNSCINPFIYAAKYREFKHSVRRLTTCQRLKLSS